MQRTWATHFDLMGSVVHDRECKLGQHHEGRDPVSVCPAVLGLRALDPHVLAVLPEGSPLLRHEFASVSCRRRRGFRS